MDPNKLGWRNCGHPPYHERATVITDSHTIDIYRSRHDHNDCRLYVWDRVTRKSVVASPSLDWVMLLLLAGPYLRGNRDQTTD